MLIVFVWDMKTRSISGRLPSKWKVFLCYSLPRENFLLDNEDLINDEGWNDFNSLTHLLGHRTTTDCPVVLLLSLSHKLQSI